ncbi:MAG: oligosaccharide flippase family protein [Bacilli bacterium]|nr:oligosaccharide flippase family protein [Bacilli bacterium]
MKKKRSISANVLFNLIYQSLTVIMPLIITPYLSRVIGSEGIGINGYTLSIVTYFVLIGSLGTAMYGQKEIAKVEDDKEKYTYKFWEILIIRVVMTLI